MKTRFIKWLIPVLFFIPGLAFADYSITTTSETNSVAAFGNDSSNIVAIQKFTTIGAGTISTVSVLISYDSGTPSDHLNCGLYLDFGGSPLGFSLGDSSNFNASGVYPTFVSEPVSWGSPVSVDAVTDYWVVCTRSGSAGAPYYVYAGAASGTSPPSRTCAASILACSSDMKTWNMTINVVEGGPPPPPSGGISEIIAYADSSFGSTTGFTITNVTDFANQDFISLWLGSGLAVLFYLRYWIVALIIISAIVYFSYRAYVFYKY